MSTAPENPPAAPLLSRSLNIRLSVMMFLQYAIWGAWLPLFFPFLTEYRGFSGEQAGWLFGIAAIGARVAPCLAGQIAERYFATEKFLGISHLVGAVFVWQLALVESYTGLLIFGLFYSLLYAPTLSLTNSLAFHHLPDRDRDFGKVRVWGTIGWIVVGIGMGQWLLHKHTPTYSDAVTQITSDVDVAADPSDSENARPEFVFKLKEGGIITGSFVSETRQSIDILAADNQSRNLDVADVVSINSVEMEAINKHIRRAQVGGMAGSFKISALLGLVLGVFCFMLPHTPPQKGESPFAFLEATYEARKNPLLTLFLVSFPISCVHQFYFVRTAGFLDHLQVRSPMIDKVFGVGGGPMTIGQFAEIVVLALMPIVATRLSRKVLLTIGLLAYAGRFALFAYFPYPAAVYPALALHGLCFGCFFFVAFMIIDENTTSDVRASAQSMYNLIVVGFGVIVGNVAAGYVDKWAKPATSAETDFSILFGVPMWVTVVCLVALLVFYPNRRREPV